MTAIRSVLVHVDASARAEERLRVALRLGREHSAELTAMYAVSSIAAEYPFAMVGDPTATAVLLAAEAEIRQRARATFDRVVAESDARATWAEIDLQPERAVSRQARYADLRGADLRRVRLSGCDLSFSNLIDADMRDSEMQGADFSGAKLPGHFAEALAASV